MRPEIRLNPGTTPARASMPGLVEKSPLKGTQSVGFTRLFCLARAFMPGRGYGKVQVQSGGTQDEPPIVP